MEENVIEIILTHFPEAEIEQPSHVNGSYKIRLPRPVNQMAGYEELRKALKESSVKPICTSCHQPNTKFRYFDNNSSKVLQARYKCMDCNAYFTLGGKQYAKDQSSSDHSTRKPKRLIEDLESDIGCSSHTDQTKRLRSWSMECTSRVAENSMIQADNTFHHHHAYALSPHPGTLDFFHQQEVVQLHQLQQQQQQQYWSHRLQHPANENQLQLVSSNSPLINGINDILPLRWQSTANPLRSFNVPGDHIQLQLSMSRELAEARAAPLNPFETVSNRQIRLIQRSQELLQTLGVPPVLQPRIGSANMENNSAVDHKQKGQHSNNNEEIIGDELKALLHSPERDCATDIWTLISKNKK